VLCPFTRKIHIAAEPKTAAATRCRVLVVAWLYSDFARKAKAKRGNGKIIE